MEDFLDGSIAPAAGAVGFPSRRGETRREFLSNTVLLDDVDDDGEGGDGVVATEDAMRAMSVVVTAVRDNAIVALLGRLRPISPPWLPLPRRHTCMCPTRRHDLELLG